MIQSAVLLLIVLAGVGTLSALGVGSHAMGRLVMALALMIATALLIAWPFLRNRTRP